MKTTLCLCVLASALSTVACAPDVGLPIGTPDAAADAPRPDAAISCAAPRALCGSTCADLQNDNTNCGGCGVVCASGTTCTGARCVVPMQPGTPPPPPACTAGRTMCAAVCCDLQSDNANCGACGNACTGSATCNAGRCVAPTPPPPSCSDREEIIVTLPSRFHDRCPGGFRVVVHGDRPGEDARVMSAGGYSDVEHGVNRYFSGQREPLRLSIRRGLWAGRQLRWSGMCPTTGAWIKADGLDMWSAYPNAGSAGATFTFDGAHLENGCLVEDQPFGENAYPSCRIPQPTCR